MTWFGLNGILYIIFIVLACIVFLASQVQLYQSGLMFKIATRERWSKALSDPQKRTFVIRFYQLFAASFCCGLLALGCAIIGDEAEQASCRQACKKEGFEDGRLRSSPHLKTVEERKKSPIQCWCRKDTEWSSDSLKDFNLK